MSELLNTLRQASVGLAQRGMTFREMVIEIDRALREAEGRASVVPLRTVDRTPDMTKPPEMNASVVETGPLPRITLHPIEGKPIASCQHPIEQRSYIKPGNFRCLACGFQFFHRSGDGVAERRNDR
jgi:hypothetical protein